MSYNPLRTTPRLSQLVKNGFAIVDVETTGLDWWANDEIIEVACVVASPRLEVVSEFSTLVKPAGIADRLLPDIITNLTGITKEMLETEGTNPLEAMATVLDLIKGFPVLAHNASFDESFIRKTCEASGLKFEAEMYDTIPFAKLKWDRLPSYSLDNLAYLIGAIPQKHRALDDARLLLEVVKRMV